MAPPAYGVRSPAARATAALAVAVYTAATVVLATQEQRATSYFSAPGTPGTQGAGLVAGVAVVSVGIALLLAGDPERWGLLATGLGAVWLAPVWFGWESGPSVVRSTAALVGPLLLPVLVHAWLRARGPGRVDPRLVAALYAGVGTLVLLRALVHDPHRDRYCWVDCGPGANVFLVHADTTLARGLGNALLLLAVVAAAGLAATTLARPTRAVDVVRGPVVVTALLALGGEAAYAVLLLLDPVERFDSGAGSTVFLLRSGAVLGLGVAIAGAGAGARATRRRVAALARELGASSAPGDLQAHLARSLRDPGLRVEYWSTSRNGYVDARGRPGHEADGRDGRASVRVVHGGRPVALIRHDPDRSDTRSPAGLLGSGARLVLDNERLGAERLAQLADLRDSRARIVAAADQHRRALERDLHDGAQQRLIAATFELRLAADDALAAGDEPLARQLRAGVDRATGVLARLREFAHGVFPAVLDEAGLPEALSSLADVAPRPVHLECDLARDPDPEAARAAYLLARAAVESPASDDGSAGDRAGLLLRVSDRSGVLVVESEGVGAVDLVHLADRAGAVGGTVELSGHRLRAVLP